MSQGWLAQYQPRDHREERLVDQLIVNDWFQQRATRRLMEVEAGDKNAPDYDTRIALIQRYKTTAERAFYRSLGAVESLRRNLFQHGIRMHALEAKEAQKLERAERAARAEKAKHHGQAMALAEQWVEVEVNEKGKTVTTPFPTNEALREVVESLNPERDLVYRRFHFADGVPEEYAWTLHDPSMEMRGSSGIQRLRPGTWLTQVEKEKKNKGHMLPCANVPRPEERGGCDCPTCSWNRELMEEEEGESS